MTSRNVATYSDETVDAAGVRARCIATVGLGNALRAGDFPGVAGRIGTINVLVHVETPLTDAALIEAMAVATEAKTAALCDARVASAVSGKPATGTGTDCTVVACPRSGDRRGADDRRNTRPRPYAGKHTAVGSAVGGAVERAVAAGAQRWLASHGGDGTR
jgi:adenosylcobinamide amidohydrolase